MKHTTSIIKLFSLALFVLVGTACIDNFDKINQKDYQVDKEELGREGYNVGASLKGLQGLVIPTEEHLYQFVEALAAGAFSGYIGCTVEWTAKFETYNPPTDWQEAPFSDLITRTYPFYRDLLDETEDPVALALGKLLRVTIMHRMTDMYGPIPYSKIISKTGEVSLTVPYDSQEEVYKQMFKELDEVSDVLKENLNLSTEAFRKFDDVYQVKGVSAKGITAAILAGDLYPATAIGINLPNANWIRAHHGSKSVTIGNITDAYNKAAHGNGFNEEFVYSDAEIQLIDAYSDLTDELHTDLHECLGHGSGKLLPGVDPDALKAYGSTIEEARADLFGLYYVADPKLVELGLLSSPDAYKAQYYTYLMNGLMTQLVRIEPGNTVEEAHMRNRQLIARWVFEKGTADKVVELVKKDGKTYVVINDYQKVRELFGELLAEIQRIKSTGDFEGARSLVENYAVKVDPALHAEVLERYKKLNLAPYKGFVNPKYELVTDENGNVTDVTVSYDEGYVEQMLRYSTDYSPLPSINN